MREHRGVHSDDAVKDISKDRMQKIGISILSAGLLHVIALYGP